MSQDDGFASLLGGFELNSCGLRWVASIVRTHSASVRPAISGGSSLPEARPLAIACLGMCYGCFSDPKHSAHTVTRKLYGIRRLPRSQGRLGTARAESGEDQPRICCRRASSRILCSRAPPGIYGSLLVCELHRNSSTAGCMQRTGILPLSVRRLWNGT